MFSLWVSQTAKRFTAGLQPKLRFSSPLRLIADLLFSLFIFLTLNRRPLSNYGRSFWIQLAYLAQLLKVTYTLRFILVEIVFREMRTFFCLVNPFLARWSLVLQKWEGSSALCPTKILNLVFSGIFVFLNVAIVLAIESTSKKLYKWFWTGKFPKEWDKYRAMPPPPPVVVKPVTRRRRSRRSGRYRIRQTVTARCRTQNMGIRGRVIWRSTSRSDSDRGCCRAGRNRVNSNQSANCDSNRDDSPRRTRSGRHY